MDTSRYRAFALAADSGSLSRAAATLSYTPSGVSQLIKALERDLGFSVLERGAHGVTPTAAGAQILPVARSIVQEEDRLLQAGAEIMGLSTGVVTIGSYPSVATHWLPRVIKRFREHYPAIEIRIMEGIHQEITAWLDSKEVDIGFISHEQSLPYDWIPLARDPMIAVLPHDHPLARAKSYPVARCDKEAFIMPGKGQDVDTVGVLSRHGLHPAIAYETIETAATLALIEEGMGMTVMNSLAAQKFNFHVAKVPIDPPEAILFGIAVPSLKACAPAVRHFVEYAKTELNVA